MNGIDTTGDDATRRRVLLAVATGTATLAGCLGGDDDTEDDPGNTTGNGDDTDGNTDDSAGNGTGDGTADDDGDDTTSETGDDSADGVVDDDPMTAAGIPLRGDPNAAVTLEVYEDFSSPVCRSYVEQVFPVIRGQYIDSGQIRYQHRDFPVRGPLGKQAANAAREVLDQEDNSAFWGYKQDLLANQHRIGAEAPELFGELGPGSLDADAVVSAATDRTHQQFVDRDIGRGESFDITTQSFVIDGEPVNTTPSFVVNDELVALSDVETIDDLIDSLTSALDAALDEV